MLKGDSHVACVGPVQSRPTVLLKLRRSPQRETIYHVYSNLAIPQVYCATRVLLIDAVFAMIDIARRARTACEASSRTEIM
jgi:hypothetical protein